MLVVLFASAFRGWWCAPVDGPATSSNRCLSPHALPEVILAIGALLLALLVLGDAVPLYGSVWLIALVYVVARLAFATRAMNGSLSPGS